ncbi:MAG: 3-deoxy-D-manno-octulosonic acid transferase [Gammaproteobacteria bacterium]|nr:3-deoxy-D-manno-octulosonic acid transferase [Gammaproteobacteria bacterium]
MSKPNDRRKYFAMLRYRLLLWIAVVPVFFLTLFQAIKHRDGRYLQQRFGLGYRHCREPGLWIHAASVGEVQAVVPLITHLQNHYPKMAIRLSTVTPTGGKIAREKLPHVQHCYLPLDLPSMAKRFFRAVNTRCGLIMETELWPNIYTSARLQDLSLITINGRISGKTLNAPTWVKQLYQRTLQQVTAVLAKSEADAQRFIQLGASVDTTCAVGNIKFAIAADFTPPKQALNIGRPFVLAASTHQGEEQLLAQLWSQLDLKEYLLVIAPRHPYRSAGIFKQLTTIDKHVAVRSKGDPVDESTRIYLADTLGELMALMQQAEVVFMGGSLVPVGGHNILEPAMLGKAVVFGPYMHNFADEAQRFLEQQAAVQVMDINELKRQLAGLLADTAKRRTYGDRARILIQRDKDMVERYVEHINRYCDLGNLAE